jgi:hypothetical protein
MDLFRAVAIDVAKKQAFMYPKDAETHAYEIVKLLITHSKGK